MSVDTHGNVVGLREHPDDVNTEAARHTRRQVFVLSMLLLILIGVAITVVSSVILGSWYISYRLGLFESQVTEWQRQTERRLDALERRP